MNITQLSSVLNRDEQSLAINPTKELPDIISQYLIDKGNKMYIQQRRYEVESSKQLVNGKMRFTSNVIPIWMEAYDPSAIVDNRIHVALDRDIINIKTGYLGEDIQVSYNQDSESDADMDRINARLKEFKLINYMEDQNSEMVRIAATAGIGYRLLYIGRDGRSRARNINPWQSFIITGAENNPYDPEYGVYYYDVVDDESTVRIVEFYDRNSLYYYKDNGGVLQLLQTQPHGFNGVPIIPFYNNEEMKGDCEAAYNMMDDYDRVFSNASNMIAKTDLALLIIKGNGLQLDEETEDGVTRKRMLILNPEDSAEYLIPNVNDQHLTNHIQRLRRDIYDIAGSVDFSDPTLRGNVPIIGWKTAYSRLSQVSDKTERKFQASLRRQYQLLSDVDMRFRELKWNYLNLEFKFNRKMIDNMQEEITNLSLLKGLVSTEDAYKMTPFIDNPEEWKERYEDEMTDPYFNPMEEIDEESTEV